MKRIARLLTFVAAVGFAGSAAAQPVSGCPGDAISSGAAALGAAVASALAAVPAPPAEKPKAKDFADSVMKTVLADKASGKTDRWGYTSHCGDGCFARSYATNYDMATGKFGKVPEGIKFKTVYIYWKSGDWSYHTAAVASGPDGDFVIDGLNGKVMTVDDWVAYWKHGDKFDKYELKDGIYMYPGESHDGKPNLTRRKSAHDVINERKRIKGVTEYPYVP